MVRHTRLFSQIVGFFDRNQFARLVSEHSAEKTQKASNAGIILIPCCFVSWLKPKASAKYPAVWPLPMER